MAPTANALGDYLRARRERIRPEDAGLVPGARRRVLGLRREELATLAGISLDYYLRLELCVVQLFGHVSADSRRTVAECVSTGSP
jgi:Helix-turn-helix domain